MAENVVSKEYTLKVLHLGFHLGCIKDFEEVAREFSLDLTSYYILSPELPLTHFDGITNTHAIYNIGHDRAKRVWDKHKDYFEQFDAIITSDTAPLSRIFLQNGFKKPLIIWVCNRFDYFDLALLDCEFPDLEYYDLFRKATKQRNVTIISYTIYEHYYAACKGIYMGALTIKPVGCLKREIKDDYRSFIPSEINRAETVFIYPRLSEVGLMYVKQNCEAIGIKTYSNCYNGPDDLKGFKGIIYFPYAWSNLALFENIQRGLIHFVPSEKFIFELVSQRAPVRWVTLNNFHLCEWYCKEHRDLFVYFDSWTDLKQKMESINYLEMCTKIKNFAQQHRKEMIKRWEAVFNRVREVSSEYNKTERLISSLETTENEEYQLLESLKKDFRNVPSLIRLAELELQQSNQNKAKNYLIAALAIEPQNVAAKTLLEKLQ